jgi:hypothetical protein
MDMVITEMSALRATSWKSPRLARESSCDAISHMAQLVGCCREDILLCRKC